MTNKILSFDRMYHYHQYCYYYLIGGFVFPQHVGVSGGSNIQDTACKIKSSIHGTLDNKMSVFQNGTRRATGSRWMSRWPSAVVPITKGGSP